MSTMLRTFAASMALCMALAGCSDAGGLYVVETIDAGEDAEVDANEDAEAPAPLPTATAKVP